VVYLVRVGRNADETYFNPQSASLDYYGQSLSANKPVEGHEMLFTSCARDDRCLLEWVASSSPSPFSNGARQVMLGHGEVLHLPDRTLVVYVEPSDAVCNQPANEPPSYDAASLATLDGLTEDERRASVERFLSLPYTSSAWRREFVRTAEFVQYRDGKVPTARRGILEWHNDMLRLRFEVAVHDRFKDAWLPAPRMHFMWTVHAHDLEAMIACATFLSVLPVRSASANPRPGT